MDNIMDEFAQAVLTWRCAEEQLRMSDPAYIDAAIHHLNAAEARVGALFTSARALVKKAQPMSIRRRLETGSAQALARVATVTEDGHLRYNSVGSSRASAEPLRLTAPWWARSAPAVTGA